MPENPEARITTTTSEVGTEPVVNLEDVRNSLLLFGNEIRKYLEHVQADIVNYKLDVEKQGEALRVEINLKALVYLKPNEAAKIIPK